MDVYDVITQRRSIRRFQKKKVSTSLLEKCVNAARLAPSAGNLQPLHYVLVSSAKLVQKIFSLINWAGYLDWSPLEDEGPVAYILVIRDTAIPLMGHHDVGMAVENMVLTAKSQGVDTCILANFDKQKMREYLQIPKKFDIELLVSFGYANEKSYPVDLSSSVEYYRKNDIMYVPKRRLEEILHINRVK